MKYLKKINESINISDIEEDLIFISDNLGQRINANYFIVQNFLVLILFFQIQYI